MKIRIDLKILFFLILFYFTNQIKIYLIIMFFSVVHEIGHIIMGLILQIKPKIIKIMPLGVAVLFATNAEEEYSNIKEIFIALAGPITSLILAILCTELDFKYSNLLILFFNLLPIYPLDGGRIVKGIIHTKLDIVKTEELINKISYVTNIIFTVISSIAVYYYQNVAIFFICIFLWMIALQEKNNKTLAILRGK